MDKPSTAVARYWSHYRRCLHRLASKPSLPVAANAKRDRCTGTVGMVILIGYDMILYIYIYTVYIYIHTHTLHM